MVGDRVWYATKDGFKEGVITDVGRRYFFIDNKYKIDKATLLDSTHQVRAYLKANDYYEELADLGVYNNLRALFFHNTPIPKEDLRAAWRLLKGYYYGKV